MKTFRRLPAYAHAEMRAWLSVPPPTSPRSYRWVGLVVLAEKPNTPALRCGEAP
jgi:hypothetical protein